MVSDVQADIVTRIEEYIPDPVVTVQVLDTQGNTIYVLGKVNRPGAYVMSRSLDVTQALALAGGLAVFADKDQISILRRDGTGQAAIAFRYGDVEYGRELGQNVLLMPGDVLIIPQWFTIPAGSESDGTSMRGPISVDSRYHHCVVVQFRTSQIRERRSELRTAAVDPHSRQ